MVMKKKPSTGRQKIPIAKIQNKTNLQITFSKRCAGLFKKANELSTFCGAEVGIIVFSPANKPFSFGQPNLESITNNYLAGKTNSVSVTQQLIEARRKANLQELNAQLAKLQNQLEAVRKRKKILNQTREAAQSESWWRAPIEELVPNQLIQLKNALEELKENASKQVNKMVMETNNYPPFLGVDQVNESWWRAPIAELAPNQLFQSENALQELKENASKQVNKMVMEANNYPPFLGVDQVNESWWRAPIEEFGSNQLVQSENALEELKKNASKQVNTMVMEPNDYPPFLGIDQVNESWWRALIEELAPNQLLQLKNAPEERKNNASKQVNKMLIESNNYLPFLGVDQVANFENNLKDKHGSYS